MSAAAKEVALIGLMVVPDGPIRMREFRRDMRENYMRLHPECGSFFLIFVLPVLISLASNWIAKWLIDHSDRRTIRMQAFDSLEELARSTTATRISTSTPKTTP